MQIPGTSIPVDFSDPKTKLIAGGLGIAGVFVLMQGRKQATVDVKAVPVTATLSPGKGLQWNDVITPPSQRGVIGQVGTYPVAGPAGTNGATGPAGTPGTPGKPAPIPTPTPTPHPIPVPPGKAYFCPSGSVMMKERGASGNDVCQRPDGSQFQVTYSSDPAHRYPVDPKPAAPPPATSGWTAITAGGRSGFVASEYVCTNKICNTGGIGANVRDRAGMQGKILFSLSDGAAVTKGGAGDGGPPSWNPFGGVRGFSTTPIFPKNGKHVTVVPGDTFMSLAQKHYNSDTEWGQITRLNPDKSVLRVGETVRIY